MPHKIPILLVDDRPGNLTAIEVILADPEYELVKALSGNEALRHLLKHDFAMVLLDVQMPDMDGFETAELMRANPKTRHLPIIFVTAGMRDTSHLFKGYESGAVDYLIKPLEPLFLRSKVKIFCELYTQRLAVELHKRHLSQANAQLQETNRKLEEAHNQLLQTEKMASIGQLAAGVAHEINNPIGFVNSNLSALDTYVRELLQVIQAYEEQEAVFAQFPECLKAIGAVKTAVELDYLKADIFKLLDESRDGMARVTKIVLDLKNFSHAGAAEWQPADLHAGLDSTLNIVSNEIRYKANVVKEYGILPSVVCLPLELNQVFMNMLVNAAQSITRFGEIRIRTGTRDGSAWIEFSDTGSGISSEHVKRIFDPFFTTKPVGQGTGLGLSLSYSIVQKHQGRIEVETIPGKGSTFRIWIPLQRTPADDTAIRGIPAIKKTALSTTNAVT